MIEHTADALQYRRQILQREDCVVKIRHRTIAYYVEDSLVLLGYTGLDCRYEIGSLDFVERSDLILRVIRLQERVLTFSHNVWSLRGEQHCAGRQDCQFSHIK